MGLRNLLRRVTSTPVVEDPNDIGTGTEDTYTLSLFEVIRRLEGRDEEDDTANFNIQEELIDDTQ